jgi:hypothetical protein
LFFYFHRRHFSADTAVEIQMKTTQSQNIVIGVLMMSALILGMLLVFVQPKTAEANMMNQTGDLIMITQGGGNGGDETLTVIDARNSKMATYGYNGQRNRFNIVAGSSLKGANPAP